jgi:2-polyprenyl-6-hydroxyphenyl methylase/3-demethylubiquinone-9 3-methyltransferase
LSQAADAPASTSGTTVDADEIARFSALAAKWWDERGPMRPLHKFNPVRLAWIKGEIAAHFNRPPKAADALKGLRLLDIGCGAGILSEPLARMGGSVVGVDPSAPVIAAARLHAAESGLAIDYRADTAENLAVAGEQFDVVLALEVVEHVTDVSAFVALAARMVRPGGLLVVSTINRTPKAFALAIVGAEYVLRWLPRGTHAYDKLVTPAELSAAFVAADLRQRAETGVMYVPFVDEFRLTRDLGVNYMMTAGKT